ncbi:MAG: SMC-Scp complex subunit ScpB [Planctomycetota bacterium]
MDEAMLGEDLDRIDELANDSDADVTEVADEAPERGPEEDPETDLAERPEEASDDASPDAEADEDEDESSKCPGPGADLSDDQIVERIVALLFASPDPLSVGKLVGLLERPPAARVRAALERVGQELEAGPMPLQLRGLRGGYTLMTVPEMGEVVGRLARGPAVERISPAALETLSIVAYRQPVTKAEIEAIRGVQAGPILRSLVDRGLVRITGRADVPGHPLQYGTTKEFLDRFGLMGLDDLPRDAELAKD